MRIKREGNDLEAVLAKCSPPVLELVERLQKLVVETAPEATERGYKGWNNITYDCMGMFCAISPMKDRVNFYFHAGVHLTDPEGLLEGTGKSMRHIKVRSLQEIRPDAFTRLIQEALKRARV